MVKFWSFMLSYLNKFIVTIVKLMPKPVVKFFSSRYIAGDYLSDAVNLTKELNKRGIYTTIDVLGEAISTREEAIASKNACMEVLGAIQAHNLLANLSIKPTQMGLMLDKELCYTQVKELLEKATKIKSFIRLDMEDTPTTDRIFDLLKHFHRDYKNVGVVVQASLKRTYDDVTELNKLGTNYRLCKGIYIEPERLAIKNRQKIRENFVKILHRMLTDGNYVGIATHDDYLVKEAYRLIKELNVPKDKFEFQMLLGVKEELRNRINADGYKVRIYVPFGIDWYRYSIRRLQENPNMALHIMKNFFSKRG